MPSPSRDSMNAVLLPAAMLMTSCCGFTSGPTSSSTGKMTLGLTARTMTSANATTSRLSAVMRMWYSRGRRSRRSGSMSLARIDPGETR